MGRKTGEELARRQDDLTAEEGELAEGHEAEPTGSSGPLLKEDKTQGMGTHRNIRQLSSQGIDMTLARGTRLEDASGGKRVSAMDPHRVEHDHSVAAVPRPSAPPQPLDLELPEPKIRRGERETSEYNAGVGDRQHRAGVDGYANGAERPAVSGAAEAHVRAGRGGKGGPPSSRGHGSGGETGPPPHAPARLKPQEQTELGV